MYVSNVQQSGLGFSLKPPKWLRNAVKSVLPGVSVQASVPTPAGPVVVDSADPDSGRRVLDALKNTRVTVGRRQPSVVDEISQQVQDSVPGGWLTIGAVALGGIVLLTRRGGRRR